MNWGGVFVFACGYEQVGNQIRLYVESANPPPNFNRRCGARSPLFHLYSGEDATAILEWLKRNRAWQCLRIPPPFTTERGVRAVLAASDWHCGEGSALFRLAQNRVIESDDHRQRLQREVCALIGSVLENPVREGELRELQEIEDVVNAAPVGVELCKPADIVDAFFGE
ncbi:hypothetical protein [Frigoriglobus tundricola]|uniref:Uncharacterized protein n=1 Tax=Frigoriglobus tundricola TaxID=2774151 RepID=A0A6M5YUZ4_9BACT|nr:hypothetical protein [Frigoriglobus tundricola]QJW97246.1 hypothetical protein FTUN_4816 [Frigoriglobus tundricola]